MLFRLYKRIYWNFFWYFWVRVCRLEVNPSYAGSFIPLVWGGGVSIMIYALGHISGAHFNPAVTLAFGPQKVSWKKGCWVPLGAIFGAVLLFSLSDMGSAHKFGATEVNILGIGFLVEAILSLR